MVSIIITVYYSFFSRQFQIIALDSRKNDLTLDQFIIRRENEIAETIFSSDDQIQTVNDSKTSRVVD